MTDRQRQTERDRQRQRQTVTETHTERWLVWMFGGRRQFEGTAVQSTEDSFKELQSSLLTMPTLRKERELTLWQH